MDTDTRHPLHLCVLKSERRTHFSTIGRRVSAIGHFSVFDPDLGTFDPTSWGTFDHTTCAESDASLGLADLTRHFVLPGPPSVLPGPPRARRTAARGPAVVQVRYGTTLCPSRL